jgi:hypothetical protein
MYRLLLVASLLLTLPAFSNAEVPSERELHAAASALPIPGVAKRLKARAAAYQLQYGARDQQALPKLAVVKRSAGANQAMGPASLR